MSLHIHSGCIKEVVAEATKHFVQVNESGSREDFDRLPEILRALKGTLPENSWSKFDESFHNALMQPSDKGTILQKMNKQCLRNHGFDFEGTCKLISERVMLSADNRIAQENK